MVRILILFISGILLASNSSAQTFEEEIKKSMLSKPRFEFKFDGRNSFISQSGVRFFGLKAGLQFDGNVSIGMGYNFLWSDLRADVSHNSRLLSSELVFRYFSPYVDYVFYRDSRWQLSIPVQIGLGESFYRPLDDEINKRLNRGFVASYEPAIAFEYRFLKYFGIGMGVGYRLMIVPNRRVEEQFTSPVYIFKLKVYFERLVDDYIE